MKHRLTHTFLAIFIMATGVAILANAQPTKLSDAKIVDFGIYTGKVEQIIIDPRSPTDRTRIITTELVSQTEHIPAIIGTKFGFKFVLNGGPKGALVNVRFVFTFPTMTNANTGKVSSRYEASGQAPIGNNTLGMFWDFVQPWELNSGKWTMMLYNDQKLLLEKTFTVTEAGK